MPGSDPASPLIREYVDFATARSSKPAKRSLEWACAAARLSDRSLPDQQEDEDEDATMRFAPPPQWGGDEDTDVDSISSIDPHEAITPDCSQASIDVFAASIKPRPSLSRQSSLNESMERGAEDDVMSAAWALCGLSQRS
jgi:hypothetical protein